MNSAIKSFKNAEKVPVRMMELNRFDSLSFQRNCINIILLIDGLIKFIQKTIDSM